MKARRQRLWKMFRGLHIGCNWNEEVCWLFELDSCFWPTNASHRFIMLGNIWLSWSHEKRFTLSPVADEKGRWQGQKRKEKQKSSFWRWNFCLFWPWLLAFIYWQMLLSLPHSNKGLRVDQITTVRRDGYISLRHIAGNVNKLGQTIL